MLKISNIGYKLSLFNQYQLFIFNYLYTPWLGSLNVHIPQLSHGMYTFNDLPIECTHSIVCAIECIHSMVIHIQYNIYIYIALISENLFISALAVILTELIFIYVQRM